MNECCAETAERIAQAIEQVPATERDLWLTHRDRDPRAVRADAARIARLAPDTAGGDR